MSQLYKYDDGDLSKAVITEELCVFVFEKDYEFKDGDCPYYAKNLDDAFAFVKTLEKDGKLQDKDIVIKKLSIIS